MSFYLEPYANLKKQEIVAEAQKEFTFFGSMKKKGSCHLFYLNLEGEVSIIYPESKAVLKVDIKNRRKDGFIKRNSVIWKPGYYLQAMNMENAIRKFIDRQKAGKVKVTGEIHARTDN